MKTLTIGGLFSGIGAHASACDRLASDEIAFKVAFQCEFDEKTAKAYDMIHGQTPNLGDITKVKDLNNHPLDILFHTPPCQDISQANRQRAGCEEGSGTRSALMFEIVRILKATDRDKLPKYLVMEEVSTLAGKYKPYLDDLLGQLSDLGYSHNYANMNAKDYGIPQNRRRLIVISKLNGNAPEIPERMPLDHGMGAYLESDVPQRYFISNARFEGLISSTEKEKAKGYGFAFSVADREGVAHCITTRVIGRKTDNHVLEQVGTLDIKDYDKNKRVYDTAGLVPTITARSNHQPKILNGSVRRITEREAWRLMGYTDAEFDSVKGAFCMTQLYKFAGNSVCVCVFQAVLKQIIEDVKQ